MRDLIEAARAELLYLPPYSPDFNPIENAFAKLTAMLRKAAQRTVDGFTGPRGRRASPAAALSAHGGGPRGRRPSSAASAHRNRSLFTGSRCFA